MAKAKKEEVAEKEKVVTKKVEVREKADPKAKSSDTSKKDLKSKVPTESVGKEKPETEKVVKKTKKIDKKRVEKARRRSKKYTGTLVDLDNKKKHLLKNAVELAKKSSYSKFDGTITLDIRLSKTKTDESIRGIVKLPHGIDKKLRIVVANEDLIEEIKKGKTDFDVLLSTPKEMPKLARVAKILGPKGLMPNPKDGTVVEDPERAKKEMAEMARYRADAHRNIHVAVGKVSWDSQRIVENVQAVLKILTKYKKDTVVLSPTMGAGVKVDI